MHNTNSIPANLFDIGSNLNNDYTTTWQIPILSPLALYLSTQPKLLEWSLNIQGYDEVVGHHFFKRVDDVNTPIFALDELSKSAYPIAQVGKLKETAAPANAYPGLGGEGAIKWLYLKDTKGGSKGGIDTVYRLETAGGMAPATCKGQKSSFEVRYAAQCKLHLHFRINSIN
jgi:hypothetical protein